MNQCNPSKGVTIRPNDKPSYHSEIRRFSKYRDRQRRIALVSNTLVAGPSIKRLRNKVKKFVKQHLFTNIENNIENLRVGNSKCCWKAIKDIMEN